METAPNLVLVGPMGAGKSAVGRRLAERLGLAFADLDEDIEQATGAAIPTIFDCEGEAGFRERERAALAARLAGEGLVLATGHYRNGVLLTPITADVISNLVLTGELDEVARPFTLDRFPIDRAEAS